LGAAQRKKKKKIASFSGTSIRTITTNSFPNKMNQRRERDERHFTRNIRRLVPDLLYTLQSAHINGGQAHDAPITLTATPINNPHATDFQYIQHLVVALRTGVISLVRRYARRWNTPPMTTPAIHALPIFFFPIDVPNANHRLLGESSCSVIRGPWI
jgi:hypothetical protein